MWWGWSPNDPRSSGIGVLLRLPRRPGSLLPLPLGGDAGFLPPLPLRGEVGFLPPLIRGGEIRRHGARLRAVLIALCAQGRGEGSAGSLLPLPPGGEGRGEGRWRTSFRDELIDLLRRQVVVVPVVEPHHRRVLACTQALDLLEAEQPVRRHLVRPLDADLLLHVVDDLVRAADHAAQVGADVDTVLADR